MEFLIWLGIILCASKAAMFSGLNLAYFSVPHLRLSILSKENPKARQVLDLRQDSNFLLATILWGNVGYNVLLTLLTNSVLSGVMSFLFSTVVLTLIGEIMPQATFSRSALKFGSFFAPVIRFYQIVLFPIAKPTAWILNKWLGPIRPDFYEEADLASFIQVHMDKSFYGDISDAEGKGAMAFLRLDDIPLQTIGAKITNGQIQKLSQAQQKQKYTLKSELVQKLLNQKFDSFVITNHKNHPVAVLDFKGFVTQLSRSQQAENIKRHLQPVQVVTQKNQTVEAILPLFQTEKNLQVLYWHGRQKRLITPQNLWELLV